jgi:hypothetical protein
MNPALLIQLAPLLLQVIQAIPETVSDISSMIAKMRASDMTPDEIKVMLDQDQKDLRAVLADVMAYRPLDPSAGGAPST